MIWIIIQNYQICRKTKWEIERVLAFFSRVCIVRKKQRQIAVEYKNEKKNSRTGLISIISYLTRQLIDSEDVKNVFQSSLERLKFLLWIDMKHTELENPFLSMSLMYGDLN